MNLNDSSSARGARTLWRDGKRSGVRARIIQAAEDVIAARGWEHATMQGVALAAGCASGTLYLYFDGKQALFDAIVDRRVEECDAAIRAAQAKADRPVAALRATVEAFLEFFEQHPAFARIFFEAPPGGRAHGPSGLRGKARRIFADGWEHDLALVKAAQRHGEIRRDVPAAELLVFLRAAGYAAVARWAAEDRAVGRAEAATTLWALILGGIGDGSRR